MSKTVKVTYNADTLQTTITVDGQPFDTSRINGKEIADWAYPFMMRKVKWNGFYDEMVEALGGDKEFNLIFEGSEESLAELKEAWEDAPVTIISEEESENIVVIEYDEKTLTTNITVNGQPFDTSRINGKEIEDWVYPFMMRKVKWDGIFEELAKVVGTEDYTVQFLGSNAAMKVLMEECPKSVHLLMKNTNKNSEQPVCDSNNDTDKDSAKNLYEIAEEYNSNQDYEKAMKYYQKAAALGNTDAMEMIGLLYLFGDGVSQSNIEAVKWITKSAEFGNADAQYMLGRGYLNGEMGLKSNPQLGVKWLSQSAKQDFTDSLFKLAECYTYGIGVNEDTIKAFECYKKCAELGELSGYGKMAEMYEEWYLNEDWFESTGLEIDEAEVEALKLYKKEAEMAEANNDEWALAEAYTGIAKLSKTENTIGYLKKAAEIGNCTAQIMLGTRLLRGDGIHQNYKEAFEWYMNAADSDDVRGQYSVGKCYYFGYGVQQNFSEAVKWFMKAAEQNDGNAQYMLGICYYHGDGVTQNYTKAVDLYRKAAENFITDAQDSLGDCYYFGHGVQQNYEKAVEWYTESANQGNVSAMYDLAICYYYGKGVDTNYQQAAELFIDAVNQGHVESMNFLGDCYYEGRGVSQNYSKAVSLYEKALNENSPQAYYNLGSCYRWGNGVRKDKEKAKELFKKGIELGNQNCKEAYEDMLKNADRIETAKRIGGKILTVLGEVGGAYAQAYYSDDDDE